MTAPHEFITRPPRDLAGWVALFDPATLPVLASTAVALEELRPVEDAVDAHLLAETVASEPSRPCARPPRSADACTSNCRNCSRR